MPSAFQRSGIMRHYPHSSAASKYQTCRTEEEVNVTQGRIERLKEVGARLMKQVLLQRARHPVEKTETVKLTAVLLWIGQTQNSRLTDLMLTSASFSFRSVDETLQKHLVVLFNARDHAVYYDEYIVESKARQHENQR